jgi:hypothetical protein
MKDSGLTHDTVDASSSRETVRATWNRVEAAMLLFYRGIVSPVPLAAKSLLVRQPRPKTPETHTHSRLLVLVPTATWSVRPLLS